MANFNFKYLRDHYFKDVGCSPQQHQVVSNPVYMFYSTGCRMMARIILLFACLPLFTIKRLPEPLHQYPVRGFYFYQWVDDLHHIELPHNKLSYAAARIVDACWLAGDYGVFSKYFKNSSSAVCSCGDDCSGGCSRITL